MKRAIYKIHTEHEYKLRQFDNGTDLTAQLGFVGLTQL